MDLLQTLEWDSKFFGFPIAKIVNPKASIDDLQAACIALNQRAIPLAYWMADEPSEKVQRAAEGLNGRLVDEKLTYAMNLDETSNGSFAGNDLVESFREGMSLADLKQLAVDSGAYSRFVVDPNFPRIKANAMFEEWIVRSVQKTYADDVLVIVQGNRVAAMATVADKGGYSNIGLVAVAEDFRGRGFGETIVRAAQNWTREKGIRRITVTTQGANQPARRLYQKCGFELEKAEFVYHFWSDHQITG